MPIADKSSASPANAMRSAVTNRAPETQLNSTSSPVLISDAEGKGEHRHKSKRPASRQCPNAYTNVAPEMIPDKPVAGFAEGLLGARHVAEGSKRCHSRLVFTHALTFRS